MKSPIERLIEIMTILRSDKGCSWDRKQDLTSLKKYLLEESYEVIDAINNFEKSKDNETIENHKEELGDLLLQIIFQSEVQSELGHFCFNDVAQAIVDKLTRRHPHVFGNEKNDINTSDNPFWHKIKEQEKNDRKSELFEDIPRAMPALLRAQKMGEKAAALGFEWEKANDVFNKIEEELAEVKAALLSKDLDNLEEEIGDVLQAIVQFARWHTIDAELALARANTKFSSRLRNIVHMAGGKENFKKLTPAEMTALWDNNKKLD